MVDDDFNARLARIRANQCERLPTPEVSVLCRGVERLRRSGMRQSCIQTGETAPDFAFTGGQNRHTHLYELLETGPVVVNFLRGFWCPFCKTEFDAYERVCAHMASLGCQGLLVTPQQSATDFGTRNRCEIIFDHDNDIAHQFGIAYALAEDEIELLSSWGIQLNEMNQSERWELPLPATYLIATDRTVVWQFVDPDFRSRCCPDELLAEVRRCCAYSPERMKVRK